MRLSHTHPVRSASCDDPNLLAAAGVVPVMALAERASLSELARDHGLAGIEVDHQDHGRHARAELRALARDLGLLATGSSDFHGTGKVDHDVGVNTTDASVVEEIRRRLAV